MSGAAVAIIQARVGSTRLPRKALLDVRGVSLLARVVQRVRCAARVDAIVVATTRLPEDDAVAAEATALGVHVYRGDVEDVLARYAGAAREFDADPVVRITSDCPLIDPGVIDHVVGALGDADFAANTLERTFPRGLDVEVAARRALEIADAEAREPYERAHVMPFIYRRPDRFRLVSITSDLDRASMRWTVDTAEDLELVRAVYARLETGLEPWREIVEVIEREPILLELNRSVRQKPLEAG